MREGFIFYQSFYESIKELPDNIQLEIYKAISEYALYGNESELSGVSKAIFSLIKPQIDANNKRYENGKKGGRPKKNENEEEIEKNQNETKIKPNKNQNETKVKPKEKDKDKDKDKEKEIYKEKEKPTLEEIENYVREKNLSVNAKSFLEYYETGNWIDAKGNKVKNWKQKILTWNKFNVLENKAENKPKYIPEGRNDLNRLKELYVNLR